MRSLSVISTLILAITLFQPTCCKASELDSLIEFTRAELLHRLGAAAPPERPEKWRNIQKACFVTLFSNNQVLACFGSFSPRRSSVLEEIAENIRLALKNDPRASIMTPQLAASCDIQITFPDTPEPLDDWRKADPLKEGLFVERSDGRGVAIVPGEARTAAYAWKSALKRLGVSENSQGLRIYRFSARTIRSGGSKAPNKTIL